MSLMWQMVTRSESEVMTAMTDTKTMLDKVMNDKDRFTVTELAALRSDLLQGGMIDSYEAAEMLQVFLMGPGYGASPKAPLYTARRLELAGTAPAGFTIVLHNLASRVCEY